MVWCLITQVSFLHHCGLIPHLSGFLSCSSSLWSDSSSLKFPFLFFITVVWFLISQVSFPILHHCGLIPHLSSFLSYSSSLWSDSSSLRFPFVLFITVVRFLISQVSFPILHHCGLIPHHSGFLSYTSSLWCSNSSSFISQVSFLHHCGGWIPHHSSFGFPFLLFITVVWCLISQVSFLILHHCGLIPHHSGFLSYTSSLWCSDSSSFISQVSFLHHCGGWIPHHSSFGFPFLLFITVVWCLISQVSFLILHHCGLIPHQSGFLSYSLSLVWFLISQVSFPILHHCGLMPHHSGFLSYSSSLWFSDSPSLRWCWLGIKNKTKFLASSLRCPFRFLITKMALCSWRDVSVKNPAADQPTSSLVAFLSLHLSGFLSYTLSLWWSDFSSLTPQVSFPILHHCGLMPHQSGFLSYSSSLWSHASSVRFPFLFFITVVSCLISQVSFPILHHCGLMPHQSGFLSYSSSLWSHASSVRFPFLFFITVVFRFLIAHHSGFLSSSRWCSDSSLITRVSDASSLRFLHHCGLMHHHSGFLFFITVVWCLITQVSFLHHCRLISHHLGFLSYFSSLWSDASSLRFPFLFVIGFPIPHHLGGGWLGIKKGSSLLHHSGVLSVSSSPRWLCSWQDVAVKNPAANQLTSLLVSFLIPHCVSTWYNPNGWLGVKHQVTYSSAFLQIDLLLSVSSDLTRSFALSSSSAHWTCALSSPLGVGRGWVMVGVGVGGLCISKWRFYEAVCFVQHQVLVLNCQRPTLLLPARERNPCYIYIYKSVCMHLSGGFQFGDVHERVWLYQNSICTGYGGNIHQ